MSNCFFENQGANTYLIFDISNDNIDNMSLGMITNNKINGFVPAIYTQIDNTRYLKYNVSARITMKEFFTGVVIRKRLLGVFSSIIEALGAAEDYMLDINSFLLNMEFIYVDVSLCNAEIICLPIIQNRTTGNDICMFFKNIMFSTQFDQTENCDYVIKIINYLNKSGSFSITDFKILLDELGKEAESAKTLMGSTVLKQNVQSIHDSSDGGGILAHKQGADMLQKKDAVPQQYFQPAQKVQKNRSEKDKAVQVQPSVNVKVPEKAQAHGEKKMSMFYLLNHYNKENAAIYRAQKEEKKTSAKSQKDNIHKDGSVKSSKGVKNTAFAVPGMQLPPVNQQSNVSKPVSKADNIIGANQTSQGLPSNNMVKGQQGRSIKAAAPQSVDRAPQAQQSYREESPRFSQPGFASVQMTDVYQETVMPVNFGDTIVLGGGAAGETTVLGANAGTAAVPKPYLVRAKNSERIMIDKPVFRIGKEKSYVDYFIGDNTAISRSHANIITREGRYYVVDTNSTNHTYINGQMICSSVEAEIFHGTKLRFANEDFEFNIY